MNTKGLFEFVGGLAFGIILGAIALVIVIYLFTPHIIPKSPCLIASNCKPQRICCTWRCDSKDMTWWKCPDKVCDYIGNEKPASCACENFKCAAVTSAVVSD